VPSPNPLVAAIPSVTPFVAPEELERRRGKPFLARLGANESAFGPSPKATQAAANFNPAHYGDPKSFLLREALSKHHRIPADHILVASGIDELLALFCRAFAAPGDTAVTTEGTYPTFAFGATAAGLQLSKVPYRDHRPDLERLAQGAKIVYLANPDNPTGALLPASEIEAFRRQLPGDCLLLLDEAYADFVPPQDLPIFPPDDPNVVRLRTFSKAHGLAGCRIGYALAHPAHIATLDKIRLHFGVNGPAQAAALASLEDQTYLADVVRQTLEGRERLSEIGRRAGLTPLPSSTNFVLFDTGPQTDTWLNTLLDRGIFVRRAALGGLRITVGTPEQMDLLEQQLPSP
jgi:histidinol-phosphate aminotransferase